MKPIKIAGLEGIQVQWYKEPTPEPTNLVNEPGVAVATQEMWEEEDEQGDVSWKRR